MIRYLICVGMLLTCLGISLPITAQANETSMARIQDKPYQTTDDWELPTFVVQTGPAHPAASPAPEKKKLTAPIARNEKRPASEPPLTASTGNEKTLYDSKHHHLDAEPLAAAATPEMKKPLKPHSLVDTLVSGAMNAKEAVVAGKNGLMGRLARLTAYWAGEGDYYTGRRVSSTGIHLHGGHCAVDPSIIPYGSVVEIPGVGQFLAVDTGSAVVSRTAAREAGHTRAERGALVIDLFFEHRSDGERFAANGPKFASISWWTPSSTSHAAREARSVFADEDWNKIYSKQL